MLHEWFYERRLRHKPASLRILAMAVTRMVLRKKIETKQLHYIFSVFYCYTNGSTKEDCPAKLVVSVVEPELRDLRFAAKTILSCCMTEISRMILSHECLSRSELA